MIQMYPLVQSQLFRSCSSLYLDLYFKFLSITELKNLAKTRFKLLNYFVPMKNEFEPDINVKLARSGCDLNTIQNSQLLKEIKLSLRFINYFLLKVNNAYSLGKL
jgi:hypothetical protein